MNKKIFLAVSILLMLIAIVVCFKVEDRNTTHIPVANEKKIEKIKSNLFESDKEISLCFDGEKLPFDSSTKTFFLPLDMENDEWEEGKLSITVDGQSSQFFFEKNFRDDNKKDLIKNGDCIPFYVEIKQGFAEYRLLFTGMPIITFSSTDYISDEGTPMFYMRVYDTKKDDDWVKTSYTKSKLRGNTSLTYEKKSLRLYLKNLEEDGSFSKNKKNLLGLRDDDDWILNSLYADPNRIRDQLAIELWNEVGANSNPYGKNYGTKSELVEVFITDNYQGIYSLMVPVDAKQLGLASVSKQLADGNHVIERIYKKKYTCNWKSEDFSGELTDANMPDYRGGFYLKGDTVLQNTEEWAPLYDLATVIEKRNAEDGNLDVSSEILSLCDERNIIENWLFYQAIAGFDNENKNYYYVVRNKDDKAYGYFIPWDMNISFGEVYAENEFYTAEDGTTLERPVYWEPGQSLAESGNELVVSEIKNTWSKWRRGAFSDDEIYNRAKAIEHRLKDSGAFEREEKRWPQGNENADFSYFYDYMTNRLVFVDEYVESLH